MTHDAGTCPAVRPELDRPLPPRMRKLSVDHRGYPVPWFVLWLPDGTPEHRAIDSGKWSLAIRERLCWVCGERCGKYLTFVLGPMCGLNRTTSEPACHHDCAEWSARNCPFLSRPSMERRDIDSSNPHLAGLDQNPAGNPLTRNPGVALLWTTDTFKVFQVDPSIPHANPGRLLRVGAPIKIEAYCEGRPATRAEIDASIAGGVPKLRETAELQGAEAVAELDRSIGEFASTLDNFVMVGFLSS